MSRLARTFPVLLLGGTLLMAQIPNPLGLPDPLGLSKSPSPSRDGRRVERKSGRERDHGKHKGQARRQEGGDRGDRKGHGRR